MAHLRFRLCKDCNTENVIHKDIKESDVDIIETMLCVNCLTHRAKLQTIKEDKLPFDKLLKKIRDETYKRMHREDQYRPSPYDMPDKYKGSSTYSTLSLYWVEQLAQR